MSGMLKSSVVQKFFSRNVTRYITNQNFNWEGEGIQYTGFKYYPRDPDFKDPPYEPTKLFRIQRIKPVKGLSKWDKEMLKGFCLLDCKQSKVVIVKNIPENNYRLWKIKHLLKIVPITFPKGFPQDTRGTLLKENGEMVVSEMLVPKEETMIALEKFCNDRTKMDPETVRNQLRKKWLDAY